jgi:shikimate dehydrogenase
MRRLGVLGWPVAHSRSPVMQNAALAHAGLKDWVYQRLPVPPELFAETVAALPAAGFAGANVTIPHKEAALALATSATDCARAVGAANMLTFDSEGAVHADNTDAPGLIAALPEPPAGARAFVLGAGGSARGVIWALRDAGADVMVWNRTPERAEQVVAELGGRVVADAPDADLLVNCTAAGLDEQDDAFKQLPLEADDVGRYPLVVDLVYGSRDTALIAAARRHGVRVVDGLEVLVRQGALSFARWTGAEASLPVMRAAARR